MMDCLCPAPRTLACRVVLLDERELLHEIQDSYYRWKWERPPAPAAGATSRRTPLVFFNFAARDKAASFPGTRSFPPLLKCTLSEANYLKCSGGPARGLFVCDSRSEVRAHEFTESYVYSMNIKFYLAGIVVERGGRASGCRHRIGRAGPRGGRWPICSQMRTPRVTLLTDVSFPLSIHV